MFTFVEFLKMAALVVVAFVILGIGIGLAEAYLLRLLDPE